MIRVDAQLSPAIADWLRDAPGHNASALREIRLRDAEDEQIFEAARKNNVIVMTKEADFVSLLDPFGLPPKVILLICGNTSNARLNLMLRSTLPAGL